MDTSLLVHLVEEATIITPTRRLAKFLTKAILSEPFSKGIAIAETPPIFAMEDWLDHLWDTLRYHYPTIALPLRLNAWQELILWQQIINQSDKVLLRPSETADNIKQAWQLLNAWCLQVADIKPMANEDVHTFCEWAEQFNHYCDEKKFISRALQPHHLNGFTKHLSSKITNKFIFFGFDEIVPSVKQLIASLSQEGIPVGEEKGYIPVTDEVVTTDLLLPLAGGARRADEDIFSKQAEVSVRSFIYKEQEYHAAAIWAKQRLAEFPEENIAIIIPNLAQDWTFVDRIFTQVFSPQSVLTSQHDVDKPYNVSSGHSLTTLAIIKTVFEIISSTIYPTSAENWSSLLRSAYLKGALAEQTVRARFDRALQQTGKDIWRLHEIIREAKKFTNQENNQMPLLVAQLEQLAKLGNSKTKNYPAEWATLFSSWLSSVGWPGDREFDSKEYQATQRWFTLLNEMSTLDIVIEQPWDAAEAVNYLQRQAANTLFQVESEEKPLQILGILEAAGQLFSSLWITSLNDDIWPEAPKPNPFLPASLQREKNMPHASAERELSFARDIFKRLLHSAKYVTCSFPLRQDDLALLPSALLNEFSHEANQTLHEVDFWATVYQKSDASKNTLENYEDIFAPSLINGKRINGGSQLLKLQAECPFRAFAAIRCEINEWPESFFGLSAMQRGSAIHSSLEWLWKKIKSWETLHSLDEETLSHYIDDAIQHALNEMEVFLQPLGLLYREIETTRLHELLYEWICLEKEREPFIVEAIEEQRQINLAGITLKLRLDRRDQLLSGGSVIIDYKTGGTNILHWNGERPDAPQLPLYAMTQSDCVGVAFAQIQTNALGWQGITAQENILPNVLAVEKLSQKWDIETWDDLLGSWQIVLEKLAEDFVKGYAAVDPKYKEQTCQYCDFKSFCRVVEVSC